MTRRINLDYSQSKLAEMPTRFGDRIDLEFDEEEGRMILTCRDPGLTAESICSQLDLEHMETFFDRSRAAREQALESGPLVPGPRLW